MAEEGILGYGRGASAEVVRRLLASYFGALAENVHNIACT